LIKYLKVDATRFLADSPSWGAALSCYAGTLIPLKWALFLSPFLLFKKARIPFIFFAIALGITKLSLPVIPPSELPFYIEGVFHPRSLKIRPSFFSNDPWIDGVLKTQKERYAISLLDKNHLLQDPYCTQITLFVKPGSPHPKTLLLKACKTTQKARLFHIRQVFYQTLTQLVKQENHPRSSSLLLALLTGKLDDKLLNIQFQAYGLAHLLALSGFHLNLLAFITTTLFAKTGLKKVTPLLSLLLLSCFIGVITPAPSIIRAFIMTTFGTISVFFAVRTEALNTLGLSLIGTSLLCPKQTSSPGFVLSFVATLSLIIYKPLWIKIRSFIGVPTTSYEKILYRFMQFVILQVFIFIMTLPFVLFFFSQTTLDSIFFNLFFPIFIAVFMIVSIPLLLCGLLLPKLASVGLDGLYTICDFVLELVNKPSILVAGSLHYTPSIPLFTLFVLIFFAGVALITKKPECLNR